MSRKQDDYKEGYSGEAFSSFEQAEQILNLPAESYILDEGQRQLVVMALAHLGVERPGFESALQEVATQLKGRDLFQAFKKTARP